VLYLDFQYAKLTLFGQTLNIPNVWPKGDRKRPAGLQNAHNFCYRRSVLQAFFHAPVFCSWLQLRAKNHARE